MERHLVFWINSGFQKVFIPGISYLPTFRVYSSQSGISIQDLLPRESRIHQDLPPDARTNVPSEICLLPGYKRPLKFHLNFLDVKM
jgi:hypothetical protein